MWSDKSVLITGATGRLGSEFARQLAQEGARLFLVGRNDSRLQQLTRQVQARGAAWAEYLSLDLCEMTAADDLVAETRLRGLAIDVLIQCASMAQWGDFLDVPELDEESSLILNVLTTTRLTRLYAQEMIDRSAEGVILLTSGIFAFQPVPGAAELAASKAYIQSLGEALAEELRESGVRLTVLAPGGLPGVMGGTNPGRLQNNASEVVRAALQGMERGLSIVIPGRATRAGVLATRLVPKRLVGPMMRKRLKSSLTRH